jgi:hypothetical protein
MLELSAEQQQAFREAVALAREREEVRRAVRNVYIALQDAIDLRRPLCAASGRCCQFEEFGHRLFVTSAEMGTFLHELGHELPEPSAFGCPFQQRSDLCGVHNIRPFGCRIFFCDATSTDWQRRQYEHLHASIRSIHEQHEVPYFYVEWREAIFALGKREHGKW